MNKYLGEAKVDIGGKDYILRPTFQGIADWETRSNQTTAQLIGKFVKGQAGMLDVVCVLYGGLVGAGSANRAVPSFEELGQAVVSTGYTAFVGVCGQLVGAAFSGKSMDEIAAPAKKKDEETEAASDGPALVK